MKKLLSLLMALMLLAAAAALAETTVYEYTEEDILIDGGDHQIPATLTLPVGQEGQLFPAVIMLHGNGSTRHEAGNAYDYTAPEMAKAGLATIRFDYIGNGDSTSDYIDFTYDKGIADAMKCYDYLSTLGVIDMNHVGIMGWSQGGRLTLLTAARNDVFTAVLTWAGAMGSNLETLEEQYAIAQENGYYEVTYDWREPLRQSPEYYECAMAIDYEAEVANIKAPILAINGLADTTVVPETAQAIVDASTNADSQVLLMEGVDHTFNVFSGDMTALEEVTQATIDWFAKMI